MIAPLGRLRRASLATRIFVGVLVVAAVFSLSSIVAVRALQGARTDLVVLTRGYLALGRTATQLRTLQEVYDDNIARAIALSDAEPSRARRADLAAFARELYPEAMGQSLDELQTLARQLQRSGSAADGVYLETVFAQARRARALAIAYDEDTSQLLDILDDDDGLGADGRALDRQGAIDAWRKRSEQASRELRTIALGVDTRAQDALARIERAEADSARAVAAAFLVALVVAGIVLWMMLRALRPLRSLAQATRALQHELGDDAPPGARAARALEALGPSGSADAELAVLGDELLALARALDERGAVLSHRTEELRRLSAFAEDVVRAVRVGVVVVDNDGRVKTINPAARGVFSLPLRDVEGKHLSDLRGAFGDAVAIVEQVKTTGAVMALPAQRLGEKIVDVAVLPLRDRAGLGVGDVLVLGDDVTAREDARERLVHSERLAAIGRLAAQITHEIRNPLSSIGLNIELLTDDVPLLPDDRRAEVQSILDAVLAEVRRLAEITEGYLRFARLPQGRHSARDLGDLCADLVAFFQSEAAAKQRNVELHVDDALPAVTVDGDRLRQALLNLVRNAVDAVAAGGTVRVGVHHREDESGSHVDVVVEDNGPGIAAADRERVFSPFFTTKADGTGLGIVVAREIAREHGGNLAVDDSALGGARFTLSLPA